VSQRLMGDVWEGLEEFRPNQFFILPATTLSRCHNCHGSRIQRTSVHEWKNAHPNESERQLSKTHGPEHGVLGENLGLRLWAPYSVPLTADSQPTWVLKRAETAWQFLGQAGTCGCGLVSRNGLTEGWRVPVARLQG
jgi:hypothetical protein